MKYKLSFDIELRENPYKGLYIALEGIDGSGKTTQAERLEKHFSQKGRDVVLTREPRKEGLIGDLVQKVLHEEMDFPSLALQYLFSTDRALNHLQVVEPALKDGKVVISDRSFWSAIPYGILDRTLEDESGYKEGEILLVSQSILSMYHRFIKPDFTFFLRTSPDEAMQRLSGKKESIELYETREKLTKIANWYEWEVKKFKKEFIIVDGEGGVEQVLSDILNKLPKQVR